MDFEDPDQIDLTGRLLLAEPGMRDPNFSRSVVLITAHDPEEGAHGYIVNRPLNKVVGDLLSGEEFAQLAEVPVFLGGPVGNGQLTLARLYWNEQLGELDAESHLSAADAKRQLDEGFPVFAFVGYSGWSGGQLEEELQQNAWIVRAPAEQVAGGGSEGKALWTALLGAMGPYYRLLSGMPEDPGLN